MYLISVPDGNRYSGIKLGEGILRRVVVEGSNSLLVSRQDISKDGLYTLSWLY